MQRTTLAMPSRDEVTMTGRSCSSRSFTSCSSTWKPSISGISMSSNTRSKTSRRSSSNATRPFSAEATWWPWISRLRAKSRRLTLLSSTTSRRAASRRSRMAQGAQGFGDARIFLAQRVERLRAVRGYLGDAGEFQLPRHGAQRERAKGVAVGLERMGRAAEFVGVLRREPVAQGVQHRWRFLQKRVHQLEHELRAGHVLER